MVKYIPLHLREKIENKRERIITVIKYNPLSVFVKDISGKYIHGHLYIVVAIDNMIHTTENIYYPALYRKVLLKSTAENKTIF